MTATLNNIGKSPPRKQPPPQPTKGSDEDETDTSYDSAEEHAESPSAVTLNKTLTKSPVSPSAATGKTDEDVAEGSRIVLQMTEEDLKQLVERIEAACPVLDKSPFQKGVKSIKWDDIKFNQYDPDTCRKAWLFLQHKRRTKRNLWEVVHEVKYSMDYDSAKFRRAALMNCPDYPKRPPGASGGLSMYCHVLLTELKEKDPSKLNYLEVSLLFRSKHCNFRSY